MAETRAQSNWAHTSAVMALIANVHRDPKKSKVFSPADFNPYETRKPKQKPAVDATTKDLTILKTLFVTNRTENRS